MNRDNLPAVRIPSSTSNLGAGFDILGLALDIWLSARVAEGEGGPTYSGTLAGIDHKADLIAKTLAQSVPPGFHLEVHSEIPMSRGLGSSAAAIVAGLTLSMLIENGRVDRDHVFERTMHEEGHPDNAGPAIFGGLFLHAAHPTKLKFHRDLGVAVAIPEQTLSTHEARDILPSHLSRAETISQASRSASLLLGLTSGDGDLIRHGMVDEIAVPVRRPLITGYDAAVQAARNGGAYGATISGAGTGIVAVCPKALKQVVAEAMEEALNAAGNPACSTWPGVVETGMEVVAGESSHKDQVTGP